MMRLARAARQARPLASATRGLRVGSGPAAGAVVFESHGDPAQVCRWDEGAGAVAGDSGRQLGLGEVAVAWLRAPVNPSDVNTVEGSYRVLPDRLPAVPGHEGVGRVASVGPWRDDGGLQVGDLVVPSRAGLGTWRSSPGVVDTDDLFRLPPALGDSEAGLDFAATLTVNPMTALVMLGNAIPGDVVLQTGANSAVGQAVVQIARAQGKRTFNIVRDRGSAEANAAVADHLFALGADAVVTDKDLRKGRRAAVDRIAELRGSAGGARLALNCVGGEQATLAAHLLVKLAEGGGGDALGRAPLLLTYGGMSREPLTLGAGALIFGGLEAHGFWLTAWRRSIPSNVWETHMHTLLSLHASGDLAPPLAARHVRLDGQDDAAERLRDALALATQAPGAAPANGKVFLDFAPPPSL